MSFHNFFFQKKVKMEIEMKKEKNLQCRRRIYNVGILLYVLIMWCELGNKAIKKIVFLFLSIIAYYYGNGTGRGGDDKVPVGKNGSSRRETWLDVPFNQFMTLPRKQLGLGFLGEAELNTFKSFIIVGWGNNLSETLFFITTYTLMAQERRPSCCSYWCCQLLLLFEAKIGQLDRIMENKRKS